VFPGKQIGIVPAGAPQGLVVMNYTYYLLRAVLTMSQTFRAGMRRWIMTSNELFHQLQLQIWSITWNRYLTEELFSGRWWGSLIFLLALYALWVKLLDKSRALEIILFGSFVAVQAVMVDIAGYSMGLWQHNIRLLPVVPGVFPIDFTVVPILLMLAHQYGSTWSKYLAWSAIASLVFSFIISPAFQYFDIKAYYNWHFAYFVVLMMAVAVTSRLTIELLVKTVQIHSTTSAKFTGFSPRPQPAAKPLPDQAENEKKPAADKAENPHK
jgi:hypothetical protein